MGLDMYLSAKSYVQRWDHQSPEEKHFVTVKKGGSVRSDIDPNKISYVVEEVGYWRKANQIHKWFVDNVQEGVDDCKEYYVSLETLGELLSICLDLLAKLQRGDPDYEEKATELLPPTAGFFFGDTEIDEWYWEDIKSTVDILQPLIKNPGTKAFYYTSSW